MPPLLDDVSQAVLLDHLLVVTGGLRRDEALVGQFKHQMSHHVSFGSNFTWSHALDYELFGPDAGDYHLTSVVIHALDALLLFLLLFRAGGAVMPSLVVAALFAVHPINVESVVWVSERKTVLSMAFFLLATPLSSPPGKHSATDLQIAGPGTGSSSDCPSSGCGGSGGDNSRDSGKKPPPR